MGIGPMHVAVIDEWLGYPAFNGKQLRSYHLLAPLARRHRITYICPSSRDGEADRHAAGKFADLGIEVAWVNRPVPRNSGPRFALRLAANLTSALPYSVQRHSSRQVREVICRVAAREKIDLWHVEWTPYVHNTIGITSGPLVIDAHNIESCIWQRYAESDKNPFRAWFFRQQFKKFVAFECEAFSRADCVITTTQIDANLARNHFGARHVEVISNGVDLAQFPCVPWGRDANELLFVGSLAWRPNLDAITQLLDTIFPAMQRAMPQLRLTIVGHDPPPWLAHRAARTPHVTLHGSVPDVRPFLQRCGALVVPLRIGSGSRIKILEALASGCPVISTKVGAEGLDLTPNEHYVLADPGKDFVASAITALGNYRRLVSITGAGSQVVRRQYGWDRMARQLDALWESQVSPSPRGLAATSPDRRPRDSGDRSGTPCKAR
jgi:glycosyltransferase involved in cell wall biosynthesis